MGNYQVEIKKKNGQLNLALNMIKILLAIVALAIAHQMRVFDPDSLYQFGYKRSQSERTYPYMRSPENGAVFGSDDKAIAVEQYCV